MTAPPPVFAALPSVLAAPERTHDARFRIANDCELIGRRSVCQAIHPPFMTAALSNPNARSIHHIRAARMFSRAS
ncbi:MAG TPA: hypothetical protein VFN87_05300 [Solirubrobacteraceae bacterium]|nr:hypothetical protein [Solirubrobacteraceae bacterium]